MIMYTLKFLFTLMMIQFYGGSDAYAFWRKTGRIRSLEGTKTGLPVVSISDDNSIRLQVYGRRTRDVFWCRQAVSIEHRRDQFYEELDTVTISCANFNILHRIIKKNFINFGDAIFLMAKEEVVFALFVLPSGSCTQTAYSHKENNIEKTTIMLGRSECRAVVRKIKSLSLSKYKFNTLVLMSPENPKGSQTIGPTYLPAKKAGPPTVPSPTVVEKPFRPPKTEQSGTQSPKAENKLKEPANKQNKPTKMADATQVSEKPTFKATGPPEPQPALESGPKQWPEVEDGLMELLSADGVVEGGYKPLNKEMDEIMRYSMDSLSIKMQNLYTNFNGNEDENCVRLLVISIGNLELERVVVTCGPVQGLTMADNFIKYRRAFVLYVSNPPQAVAIFNTKGGHCIRRTYFVQLISKSPGYLVERVDEETQEQLCLDLKKGSVTGDMYGIPYDDSRTGLQDDVLLEVNPPDGPGWKAEDAAVLALVAGPGPLEPEDSDGQKTSPENIKPEKSSAKPAPSKSPENPGGLMSWGSSLFSKISGNITNKT